VHRLSPIIVACALTGCGGAAPPGIVSLGEIVVSGEVNTQSLVAQMHQLDPRLEACYARAKRQDHSVQGNIALHIQGGEGRLTPEVSANTTGSASLAECVSGAVASLAITEPAGGPPWNFTADWTVGFTLAGQQP
jgi:hypothetical protein